MKLNPENFSIRFFAFDHDMKISSLVSVDIFIVGGETDSSIADQIRSKYMSPLTAHYDCATSWKEPHLEL